MTIKSLSKYVSCDNESDAFRSLAMVYRVDEEQILSVYRLNWPDFLPFDVDDEIFRREDFAWLMSQYMRSEVPDRGMLAAYYHRGLYDGTPAWFDKGLLSARDGTCAFLEQLMPYLPTNSDRQRIKQLALSNVITRSAGEGVFGLGPHAFDRFEDARAAERVGCDFSQPEFFLGTAWELLRGTSSDVNLLIETCKRVFRPVVVKFLSASTEPDRYINNLWHYLHRTRFGIDLTPNHFTFLGRGQAIPPEMIVRLIEI